MARIASVLKQGFYPAPPAAIAGILRHLKIPDPPPDSKFKSEDINVLDPCAGEGKALVQLAEGLGVSKDRVFAIELNASRAARIAEAYPEVRLLGPCSFEGTRITRQSFSLGYLHPPFDDQFSASGREEVAFLRQTIDLLVPGGVLVQVSPVNQVSGRSAMISEMMIGILIVFANYERRLISVRTREGLQARKQRGERYCRWAEYGWAWVRRHDPALGKDVNVKVADEGERVIMAKCVELRAAGYSLDKIRQHLNYEMKARTRLGGHWTTSRVAVLVRQGLRFLAENVNGTKELLASVDEEEDYENIVVLEDEIDD
jgi:hypothetical protein